MIELKINDMAKKKKTKIVIQIIEGKIYDDIIRNHNDHENSTEIIGALEIVKNRLINNI